MVRFNSLFVVILVIISACNSTPKANQELSKNTFLVNIKRFNRDRGVQENYRIDKRDYKIIQNLDTLAGKSFYVSFHLNSKGQVSHLLINSRYKKNISEASKVAIFDQLKSSIFNSDYNLSNLKSLKKLDLQLSSLNHPIKLKFPQSLNHLKVLSISENPIKRIEFAPNNKLGLLRLVACELSTLDSVMINLNQLQTLFVMNNKIKDINFDVKQYQHLKLVNLSGNPLRVSLDSLQKKYPSVNFFLNENQPFSHSIQ